MEECTLVIANYNKRNGTHVRAASGETEDCHSSLYSPAWKTCQCIEGFHTCHSSLQRKETFVIMRTADSSHVRIIFLKVEGQFLQVES